MKIEINDFLEITCNGRNCDFMHLYSTVDICGYCPLDTIIRQGLEALFEGVC